MILPVQMTFRNMDASAAVAARVQEKEEKLDNAYWPHPTEKLR